MGVGNPCDIHFEKREQAVEKRVGTLHTAVATFSVVAELSQGPGNITVTFAGDIITSLHQFYGDDLRVARIGGQDQLISFAEAANVNSALGVQADANGVIWMLDNAMRDGDTPRLVAWHVSEDRLIADIDLSSAS